MTFPECHDRDRLALACLAHLEQEEALLGATRDGLGQVRAALLQGNLKALANALQHQAHTTRAGEELRHSRARLRQELARVLGLPPPAVTVQELARHVPAETGQRLLRWRERLHALAEEVQSLNRGNAALVRHSLDFLHRFLAEITGSPAGGGRYSPAGQRQDNTCGPLIEARG